MERMTRDEMLMGIAVVTSARGTCSRLKVGAVFSKEGRIIVNGYNGAVKGQPHCNHDCTCDINRFTGEDGHEDECPAALGMGCLIAQHAERNALDFAARHGLGLEGSTLHVTHMPCYLCAGSLINAGIVAVTYGIAYRLTEGVELLASADIEVQSYSGRV